MPDSSDQTSQELRRQLKAYVSHAQLNEQKLLRMQQQELRFISASSFSDLLNAIINDYREFYQLEAISLLLLDEQFEIRRIVERLSIDLKHFPQLIFIDKAEIISPLLKPNLVPWLGKFQASLHHGLFRPSMTLESIALIPLHRAGKLIGMLNLGSRDSARFISGSATDLLQRLSAILGVCIENALNHERVKLIGLIDPLTGVYNRRYFDERLTEEHSRCQRTASPLSCLFIDIDFFKKFNDQYGHAVGDLVLQRVAQIIRFQMRKSDVLCRYGGEEFAVLLADTSQPLACDIAERIRRLVADEKIRVLDAETPLHVTVSIGCSSLEAMQQHVPASELLECADQALYQSKHAGRNRVTYFDPQH